MTGLNPDILRWARLRSGLEVSEVAALMKRQSEEIERWEDGGGAPTYAQLEKLAYRVYKRPLALFFFPAPPEEPTPERSFRTLPDFEVKQLDARVRLLIRDGLAKQEMLRELAGSRNPVASPIFKSIHLQPEADVVASTTEVRKALGVDLAQQQSSGSTDEALKLWRLAVEQSGVFVFKNSFGTQDVSGFCLYHEEFPVIYLNNNTAKTRQIFTLIHELAHILLSTGGVTKFDDSYISSMSGTERRIEVFCNRFAGEFLVPSSTLKPLLSQADIDDELLRGIAESYRVSREVILRRAMDFGFVSSESYEKKRDEWNEEFRDRRGGTGGNYYATQATYLGSSYLRLAFDRFYKGAIDRLQLADYLGVRAANLSGLEDQLLSSAVS